MTDLKKSTHTKKAATAIFSIALIIMLFIIYLGFRDFSMTPFEQLQTAQTAQENGSFKKAERYYRMAAASDNKEIAKTAAYRLGLLYRNGAKGVAIDGPKAEIYLEQAAIAELPQAQYELALLYDTGDKIPENRERAVRWMERAAQNNLTEALFGLAVWAERGYLGTVDPQKIVILYEKAAAQDHIYAITSLIAIYSGAKPEIQADPEKAQFWTKRLIDLTHVKTNQQPDVSTNVAQDTPIEQKQSETSNKGENK